MGRGRSPKTLALRQAAYDILAETQPASVRSVCYQLFIRNLIESMSKQDTNKVSGVLTGAREEEEIPWEWIVQEGRPIESPATWDDPAAFGRAVQQSYRRNKWLGQPTHVVIVSEKATVRGTLQPLLDEFELDFLAIGGFGSTTRVKDLERISVGKPTLLLYLGDHDPSGRDMSDHDLPRRLARYVTDDLTLRRNRKLPAGMVEDVLRERNLELRRIALTEADGAALGRRVAFPARAKRKDSRYAGFVKRWGHWCWELDALSPNVLRERVRDAVLAELDLPTWERYVTAEAAEIESISRTIQTWNSISGLAKK